MSYWIIFSLAEQLQQQPGEGQPSCPAVCPVPVLAHTFPDGSGRRKYHGSAPWCTDLFWLTDFHPQKCFPHSAVLLMHTGNIKVEPRALLGSEDSQRFGVVGLFS